MAAPTPGTCSTRPTRPPPAATVAWQNAGIDYTFGANGQMSPAVSSADVDRRDRRWRLARRPSRCNTARAASPSSPIRTATSQVNQLQQNGFPAGVLQRCRSTTRAASSAPIPTAAPSTWPRSRSPTSTAPTASSASTAAPSWRPTNPAPPTYSASGKIVGSSLEGSNTDIADEFTKLIVTQQAYSANTRVITTSNQMVQDLLNMLR